MVKVAVQQALLVRRDHQSGTDAAGAVDGGRLDARWRLRSQAPQIREPSGDARQLRRRTRLLSGKRGDALGDHLRRFGFAKFDRADALSRVRASNAWQATKLVFEFIVLTACRSSEARGAAWSEIDGGAWTIPAERMKAQSEHRVPLSPQALAVLEQARSIPCAAAAGDLVFPSVRGRQLSDSTISNLLRTLGVDAVPHGFRSSFRDWASECTDAPHAVMEAALAHAVRNRAEAAYARSDLLAKRRELMDACAAYAAPSS